METKPENSTIQRSPDEGLTLRQIFLIGFTVVLMLAGMVVAASRLLVPPPRQENLAHKASLYLRQRKGTPLSAPLQELLSQPDLYTVPSQEHSLVGKPAPDFTLNDHLGQSIHLRDLNAKGPVVVIFYYGYWCDHCVAQLFGVHEDILRFKELQTSVVAVSADTAELTKERFAQYGAFAFPAVSDPDNKVASRYDCTLKTDDGAVKALHGTFVIGRDGVVHWANTGHQPFLGNTTLLYELAKLEGRLGEKAIVKDVSADEQRGN